MPQPFLRRLVPAALATALVLPAALLAVAPSAAAAPPPPVLSAVRGSACGYYVNVGLFGGPQSLRGCGQTGITHSSPSYSPSALLLPSGSVSPVTDSDPDGAKAVYGPAVIYGGEWPCDETNCPSAAPASGPTSVSTQGTPGGGTVVASADIVTYPTTPTDQRPVVGCDSAWLATHAGATCHNPGGYGPYPVSGDELHVSCTASATEVTGSTALVNGVLATSTDAEGNPKAQELVPASPPVNYTRSGVITNVGDVFTVVYNEHIHNADGSLTVNGAHMYLFGPTAIGEVVKGQVTCGTTPPAATSVDTVRPVCGTPVVEPVGPDDPTPKSPRTELVGVFDAGLGRDVRTVADGGTATSSTTLTSATAAFTAADVGAAVGGGTIFPGAVVSSVTNATTAVMSAAATGSTTTGSVTITRQKGIQSISNLAVVNGTVRVGTDPNDPLYAPGHPSQYLVFTPGQTWPLQIVATRTAAAESANLPMVWSFDATDGVGNVTHCRGALPVLSPPVNFDTDNRSDVAVFRPGGGTWFDHPSSGGPDTGVGYGVPTDVTVPADYDGDRQADIAVFRPSSGLWAIHQSGSGFDRLVTYGIGSDIPVPGDYDGDGKADIAVYRPSTGAWYVHRSSDDVDTAVTFGGISGDVAIPSDYDGDGKADVAIFRPSTSTWFVHPSAGGADTATGWGTSGDVPMLGDYDGDGRSDAAVFRPSTGLWAVLKTSGGTTAVTYGGVGGDMPVPGDYDGDRVTDIAVFRPSLGAWYRHLSLDGSDSVVTFGVSGDRPLALPAPVQLAYYP